MDMAFQSHPILGWLRRTFGLECPLAWAEWAAGQLLQDARQVGLPVDLSPMLIARKTTIIGFDQHLPCEARLETAPTGFLIRLSGSLASEENEGRRRFALAHELGHTFFYDLNELPPERIIHLPLHDPVEEEVCDKFAAALLVPCSYLQSVCREPSSGAGGLTLLDRVSADCGVPRPVAALRLRQGLPGLEHDWLSAIARGWLSDCVWSPRRPAGASTITSFARDEAPSSQQNSISTTADSPLIRREQYSE